MRPAWLPKGTVPCMQDPPIGAAVAIFASRFSDSLRDPEDSTTWPACHGVYRVTEKQGRTVYLVRLEGSGSTWWALDCDDLLWIRSKAVKG